MEAARVDTSIFKPHSTRAASTSKAVSCDVPIHSILRTASWKSDCVFHGFYYKDIESEREPAEFGKAILLDAQ